MAPVVVEKALFEDKPASDGISENHHVSLPARGIFVVADGVGGPVVGKAAARSACEGVVEFLVREAGDREATLPFVLRSYFSLAGNVLFNSIIHANRRVLDANGSRGVHERGAASVVAGYLDRDILALASVGSVSAWLKRGGEYTELVTPRSWGRLVDPSRTHPSGLAGVLPLMALGVGEDLEPEIVEIRILPGDELWVGTQGPVGLNKIELFQGFDSQGSQGEAFWLNWAFNS